jgi:hypothetical protein
MPSDKRWSDSEVLLFHLRELEIDLRNIVLKLEQNALGITSIENGELQVDFAHLYHHLNSGWNSREYSYADSKLLEEKFLELAKFPTDLTAWSED